MASSATPPTMDAKLPRQTSGEGGANGAQSTADLTMFVQTLLTQMQTRFQTMSDSIITKIDEMGSRIDELEKSIGELAKEVEATPSPAPGAHAHGASSTGPSGQATADGAITAAITKQQ
eukprot:TRINITY_DN26966_c0_g1_i1.p1 TRINITY_DN26966_c0_g1~~TRINITY_DN26966_c0_g1_i1.p1  ORF type:complete len:119 (-),score=28.26 TRINITY_DN26966_c0_g1_i1:879-1235(-)